MTLYRSIGIIALGGNLPFKGALPQQTLAMAVAELAARDLTIRAVSRFFNTPCFPAGAGPDYVNAAATFQSNLTAQGVLERLHDVEASFARERLNRWGTRTLDLDLIALGDLVCPDVKTQTAWRALPSERQKVQAPDQLILPHPRLQDRAFVLIPMADVAADWVHPVLGLSVRQMCAALPEGDRAEVCPI